MEYLDWYDRVIKIAGIKYELDSTVVDAYDPLSFYDEDYSPSQFVEYMANHLGFDVDRNIQI